MTPPPAIGRNSRSSTRLIADEMRLGAHEMVVCGMALGHADPEAIADRLVTARAGVEEFAVFHDAAPEPTPPAAGAGTKENR
jgi:hypothetical protein